MNCACVAVDVDDYSTDLTQEVRTARKPHKCNECRRKIAPGEKYEYYVGLFDGIFTHKTCGDCLSIRQVFFCDGWYFEQIREYLDEHIRECGGEISEQALSSLTPAAREYACDAIEEQWRDDE